MRGLHSFWLTIQLMKLSALSLRLFGEDVTIGARDAAALRRAEALQPAAESNEEDEDVAESESV